MAPSSSRPYFVCATITGLNALVSAGFSVAALFGPTAGAPVALYAASRSVSLLLVALGLFRLRSRGGLAALAITMTLVQAFDAAIGVRSGDAGKTIGPAVFAVATAASAWAMLRRSPASPAGST